MTLFRVDTQKKTAEALQPTNFKALELWERKDIQEWVKTSPELIEEEVLFLTSEFDQFDKTKERIDVLGIKKVEEDGSTFGRLVVVELKRDSHKGHALQALQYAAYVSGFSANDVIPLYAEWEGIDEVEAGDKLAKFLEAESPEEIEIDSKPMLVLMAQRFREETTTTVMWMLEELKLDVSCVRLVPYEIDGHLFVQTDKIIPLPEAETYRMAKQSKEDAKKPGARKQGANILNSLIENDVLADGDQLYFRQAKIPKHSQPDWPPERNGLEAKLSTAGDSPALVWSNPETGVSDGYTISRLASIVLALVKDEPGPASSAGVQGVEYWEFEGKSLKAMASDLGLTSGGSAKFETEDVREFCSGIPVGRWTSYGVVARALDSPRGAQSVSGILAGLDDEDNPHRVLRKNGEIPPNWGTSTNQMPIECRERLESEGVTFNEKGWAETQFFWEPDSPDISV